MKFHVIGSFYGELASLSCESESKDQAIQRFKDHFGDRIKGFNIICHEIQDYEKDYWKHDGYVFYSDGKDYARTY